MTSPSKSSPSPGFQPPISPLASQVLPPPTSIAPPPPPATTTPISTAHSLHHWPPVATIQTAALGPSAASPPPGVPLISATRRGQAGRGSSMPIRTMAQTTTRCLWVHGVAVIEACRVPVPLQSRRPRSRPSRPNTPPPPPASAVAAALRRRVTWSSCHASRQQSRRALCRASRRRPLLPAPRRALSARVTPLNPPSGSRLNSRPPTWLA